MNPHRPQQNTHRQAVYQYTSLIPTSLEVIIRFHEKRNALSLLTPPPLLVQIIDDQRMSLTQGTVEFVLWFGPVPVRWVAQHEPGPTATSFIDRMLVGPMTAWEHQHIFRQAEGGVELLDKVQLTHKRGWRGRLARVVFSRPALKLLFWYRHWRTRRECRKVTAVGAA
jgi:ligand-binding SRPBCC domain-containing protein